MLATRSPWMAAFDADGGLMVRVAGLEPASPSGRRILSSLWLPFHHTRVAGDDERPERCRQSVRPSPRRCLPRPSSTRYCTLMAAWLARMTLLAGLAALAACVPGPPPPIASGDAPPSATEPVDARPAAAPSSAIAPALDRRSALAAAGLPASPTGNAADDPLRLDIPDGVLFDTASDQPLPGAAAVLARLATVQRQSGGALTVLGHTDAIGSDSYNLGLSARRARSVITQLTADGVPPALLSAVAIGRRQPIASNATPDGRARNRRVEFLLGDTLGANLAAVQASGQGEVAVLRPDAQGLGLVEAERITLPEPLPTPRLRHPAEEPRIHIRQPEPVTRAPLTQTPTF